MFRLILRFGLLSMLFRQKNCILVNITVELNFKITIDLSLLALMEFLKTKYSHSNSNWNIKQNIYPNSMKLLCSVKQFSNRWTRAVEFSCHSKFKTIWRCVKLDMNIGFIQLKLFTAPQRGRCIKTRFKTLHIVISHSSKAWNHFFFSFSYTYHNLFYNFNCLDFHILSILEYIE